MRRIRVAVIGSTGSVGRSALDVVARLRDRYELVAVAARKSVRILATQVRRYRPGIAVLTDPAPLSHLRRLVGNVARIECGPAALIELARADDIDTVVMAMSGTDGLLPTLAALKTGKRVALATKELLVSFGEHILRAARRGRGEVLPVDSELAAIHQCLDGRPFDSVARLVLTASGGPFWRTGLPPRPGIRNVLRHPTWNMGRKITVDSATLMNKGLEIIETVRLFRVQPCQVDVVIHPQSLVHGLVEFTDGSMIGHLSSPDMRLPIQYSLTYPARLPSPIRRLDLTRASRLDFHDPDSEAFPCLGLARRALRQGGIAPCVLVAADQVAVEAFLGGQIDFGTIPSVISNTLSEVAPPRKHERASLKSLLTAQSRAIAAARRHVEAVRPKATNRRRRT